jgi:Cofactor assembly of complex C subunit B, CCB2/CCB4
MNFASTKIRLDLWLLSYFLIVALLQFKYHAVTAFSSKIISHTQSTTSKHVMDGRCAPMMMMMTTKNDGDDATKYPKIKFTSLTTSIPTNTSPVDVALSWLTSDIGSIALGGLGLLLLLIGRLILDNDTGNTSPEDMAEQTRVNLLAVFAVGAVLLNGLSQLDVQSALAEKVDLLGKVVSQPIILKNNNYEYENINEQISWVLSSILAATPTNTVILLVRSENEKEERWKPIAYVGVLPPNMLNDNPQLSKDTPIMDRMLRVSTTDSERRESYLPTLQALPGRIEFTNYLLPPNTQAVLLLPIRLASSTTATLLLGSNQARSFTPRDITWSQSVATRLELPFLQ